MEEIIFCRVLVNENNRFCKLRITEESHGDICFSF